MGKEGRKSGLISIFLIFLIPVIVVAGLVYGLKKTEADDPLPVLGETTAFTYKTNNGITISDKYFKDSLRLVSFNKSNQKPLSRLSAVKDILVEFPEFHVISFLVADQGDQILEEDFKASNYHIISLEKEEVVSVMKEHLASDYNEVVLVDYLNQVRGKYKLEDGSTEDKLRSDIQVLLLEMHHYKKQRDRKKRKYFMKSNPDEE